MLRFLLLGAIINSNVFLYINHTQGPHIRAKFYSTLSVPFFILKYRLKTWLRFGDLISTFYFNLP